MYRLLVQYDQRLVELKVVIVSQSSITVTGPVNGNMYSPGRGCALHRTSRNRTDSFLKDIFVLADGIPSVAVEVMVGNGKAPPFDAAANAK